MKDNLDYNLGIIFKREHAPEKLPDFARRAKGAGSGTTPPINR
jgi:hypothetical protein